MTLILVEGVDGAGKSTLAEAIISELEHRFPGEDIRSIHRSQLTRDPLDEYALDLESYRPGSGEHIVADRWHFGEMIYGPLYRDTSALTVAGFRWVELYLRARGATMWHVTASLQTIQDRLRHRGEDYLESRHVGHVRDEFTRLARESVLPGGTIETDDVDVKAAAAKIVDEAVFADSQAAYCFRPEYIGRSLPNAVLVGDKQGPGAPGVTLAPFLPRGTSSGSFLMEALHPLSWGTIGIVNGNETKLPELLESLFDPAVVALGTNASETLAHYGIEHGTVPHPQKIRRFHHDLKVQYGWLIQDVSERGGNRLTWPR